MEAEGSPQIEHVNTLLPFIPAMPLGARHRRLPADDTATALSLLVRDFKLLLSFGGKVLHIIAQLFTIAEVPRHQSGQFIRLSPLSIAAHTLFEGPTNVFKRLHPEIGIQRKRQII